MSIKGSVNTMHHGNVVRNTCHWTTKEIFLLTRRTTVTKLKIMFLSQKFIEGNPICLMGRLGFREFFESVMCLL